MVFGQTGQAFAVHAERARGLGQPGEECGSVLHALHLALDGLEPLGVEPDGVELLLLHLDPLADGRERGARGQGVALGGEIALGGP